MSLAGVVPGCRSGRQLVAALTSTGGQDGATGAGTHSQAEAMGLGPATVVGLKGALAHGYLSTVVNCWCGAGSLAARESAPRFTDSTKRPDRADAVQGTDRQAGRSNSPSPTRCGRLFGTTRHADGGACRLRGLVGSAGKLLASGSHDSEPPSPPERLFRGAAVSRRRGPLPFPTRPHMWITIVDGGRGPIAARGSIE